MIAASAESSANGPAIVMFSRDATTGRLTQLEGGAGCIAIRAVAGCSAAIPQLEGGTNGLALSGDGRVLALQMDNGVALLELDQETGRLTPIAGACFWFSRYGSGPEGCAKAPALENTRQVVLNRDGTQVVVGAGDDGPDTATITTLRRGADGHYAIAGCVTGGDGPSTCRVVDTLSEFRAAALSPDATRLYVSSIDYQGSVEGAPARLGWSALLTFTIDADGGIAPAAGRGACVAAAGPRVPSGCVRSRGFVSAYGLDLSPTGRELYVAWSGVSFVGRRYETTAVEQFAIDPATGGLARVEGARACASSKRTGGCATAARGNDAARALAVAPSGRTLAVVSAENSIASFTLR